MTTPEFDADLTWLKKASRVLMHKHVDTYMATKSAIRPGPIDLADDKRFSINPMFFQPYGTLMDFSKDVYLNARVVNPRGAPSVYQPGGVPADKAIKPIDDYVLKTELKNNALIQGVLKDFNVLDGQKPRV